MAPVAHDGERCNDQGRLTILVWIGHDQRNYLDGFACAISSQHCSYLLREYHQQQLTKAHIIR